MTVGTRWIFCGLSLGSLASAPARSSEDRDCSRLQGLRMNCIEPQQQPDGVMVGT